MPDICQIGTPDRMPEYMSDIMPEYMSDRVSVKSSDSVLDDKVKCQNIYVTYLRYSFSFSGIIQKGQDM